MNLRAPAPTGDRKLTGFCAVHESETGTFETCRPSVTMSVSERRPEVTVRTSKWCGEDRKCGPNLKPTRLTRNGRTPGICLSACIIRSSAVRTGLSIRMPAISRSFPAGKPRPEGAPDRSDSPAAVQAGPPPCAFRRARGDRALRDRTQREAWSQPER
jgi:hypothetical protein